MLRTNDGARDGWAAAAARRPAGWLGVLLLAMSGLAILAWSAPAHAHTDLVSSSPEPGAEVSMALDRIRLVFGDDLLPVGNDVVVRDPVGTEVSDGEPTALGSTLEVPMALTTPGRHLVSYRVVGRDGHVIAGDLWFTAVADGIPHPDATAVSPGVAPRERGEAPAPPGATTAAWLLGGAFALTSVLAVVRRRTLVPASVEARHDGAGRSPDTL